MSGTSRAKATIEELKKLFSRGRKPSEEDFAKLIDTLNDEVDDGLFYTREEVDNLIETVSTGNTEAIELAIAEVEKKIDLKADSNHEHVDYLNINNSLTDQDLGDVMNVFKGILTVEEALKLRRK